MAEMIHPPLENGEIQVTEHHRLAFDVRNKIIKTRYVKREGKGKNAKETNQYGYGQERYYGSWETLAKRLMELEFEEKLLEQEIKNIHQLVEAINKATKEIEQVGKDIAKVFSEKIEIDVGSGRGRKASEDGDDD